MGNMSDRFSFSYTSITVALFGLALLILGGVIAYFAVSVTWAVGPRILTPLGVMIALLGLLVLTSKEG
jgi:hypothetical protein